MTAGKSASRRPKFKLLQNASTYYTIFLTINKSEALVEFSLISKTSSLKLLLCPPSVSFTMENTKEFSHFSCDRDLQDWLKTVFQNEDIPFFDETPEFIETLKAIMAGNKVAEKDAKTIIKAEKNLKNFYNNKAEELQLVTDFLQLNSETCQRLESLASLAEKMKLKEPSLTNFLLGMTELEDQELLRQENKIITDHHLSIFRKKILQTMKTNEKLRRYLKTLTNVVERQKTHYTAIDEGLTYFEKKKEQVDDVIIKNKEILEKAGYEEKYRHSVLVKNAQELKHLEERLKTLESKLQAYHSLNPSFSKTEIKVKAKESELMKFEAELQLLLQEYEKL